jgi:hypothetical protein
MEAFEHMIVDEFNEEDFYETIEAPKFVDLTAPDHRPEGDDRYWFCSRVGCDQKHEEFLDSEAIYKKFVLRVSLKFQTFFLLLFLDLISF